MTHEWFTPHAQKALAERGVDWRRYARSFHAGLSFDPTFSALVDRTLGMGCMGGVAARKLEHMGASLYHDLMSIHACRNQSCPNDGVATDERSLSLVVLDIFAFLLGGVVLVAGGLTPWGDAFSHTLGVVTGYLFARLFR